MPLAYPSSPLLLSTPLTGLTVRLHTAWMAEYELWESSKHYTVGVYQGHWLNGRKKAHLCMWCENPERIAEILTFLPDIPVFRRQAAKCMAEGWKIKDHGVQSIQGIVCRNCKDICGWVIDDWLMKATEENMVHETIEESRAAHYPATLQDEDPTLSTSTIAEEEALQSIQNNGPLHPGDEVFYTPPIAAQQGEMAAIAAAAAAAEDEESIEYNTIGLITEIFGDGTAHIFWQHEGIPSTRTKISWITKMN